MCRKRQNGIDKLGKELDVFGRLRQGPGGPTMENKKESTANEAEKLAGARLLCMVCRLYRGQLTA